MEHTENDEKAIRSIAEFRFGLVAPVSQNTFPDESIAAYCRRITEKPFVLPDCIRRNQVAAFAVVSGHGAERVAGLK